MVYWFGWFTWLVDVFCLDNSWIPVPSAVELSLQVFKQTQKLTFTVVTKLLEGKLVKLGSKEIRRG